MGRQDTYGTYDSRKEKRREDAEKRQALYNSLTTKEKIKKLMVHRAETNGPLYLPDREFKRLTIQLNKEHAEKQEE